MNFKKELFCDMKKDTGSDLNLVQQITEEIGSRNRSGPQAGFKKPDIIVSFITDAIERADKP